MIITSKMWTSQLNISLLDDLYDVYPQCQLLKSTKSIHCLIFMQTPSLVGVGLNGSFEESLE